MRGVLSAALICGLALSGCATKRYTRVAPLSAVEMAEYSCKDLRIERSKIEAVRQQIDQEDNINFMSVMGFLADFGIGNVNEKNTAQRMLNERSSQLSMLEAQRGCGTETATPAAATAAAPGAGGVTLLPAKTPSGFCVVAPPDYQGTGSPTMPAITSGQPRCETLLSR